ncbi:hypothetical protein [Tunturiibacter lichenicola]|uniref:hypothetical protein n=1 Tax=Tunturiibacter lichenicola TaxID=2051959 RepID=UPI003D9BDCB1
MSVALYSAGYLLVIACVCYLADLSHIPEPYIAAIAVIMLGIGVVGGVETARQKHSNSFNDF